MLPLTLRLRLPRSGLDQLLCAIAPPLLPFSLTLVVPLSFLDVLPFCVASDSCSSLSPSPVPSHPIPSHPSYSLSPFPWSCSSHLSTSPDRSPGSIVSLRVHDDPACLLPQSLTTTTQHSFALTNSCNSTHPIVGLWFGSKSSIHHPRSSISYISIVTTISPVVIWLV